MFFSIATNPNFMRRGTCYVSEMSNNHRMRNNNPTKGDDIIVAVVSQVNIETNMNKWVVDSGATRHICANRDAFTSYTSVGDEEKFVYLSDSKTATVLGKGKILLKLTSGNIFLYKRKIEFFLVAYLSRCSCHIYIYPYDIKIVYDKE
jgi:hypothetical protein